MSVDSSLEGIVAARTELAMVDGRKGLALVRGYPLPDLAAMRTYDDVAHLVLRGNLPANRAESDRFARALAAGAALSRDDEALCRGLSQHRPAADALAAAVAIAEDQTARDEGDPVARAERVLGRIPSVCAAVAGVAVPPGEHSYARRALAALGSRREEETSVRALEVLLCLESEHGLSASTFACRVAASSGANAGPCLSAAVATLSGERHGGATAHARSLLLEAHAAGDLAGFVREKYQQKARLPGFGHRVYKVADPRVPPLRDAMGRMTDARLLPVARGLESHGAPLYGAKGVHANIDLYGAALLDALGVPPENYVAAFALGVACGWLAHWAEQRATGRLIRPESEYGGPSQRAVPTRHE